MILNPTPSAQYHFSNEYYRALARFVLDLRYRNSMLNVKNDRPSVVIKLMDAGFSLNSLEISAFINNLLIFDTKMNPVESLINEINGLLSTSKSYYRPVFDASVAEQIIQLQEGDEPDVVFYSFLINDKVPPPVQVKSVRVVPE